LWRLLRQPPGRWDLPELPAIGGPLQSEGAVAAAQAPAATAPGPPPLLVAPAGAALVGSRVDDAAIDKLAAACRAACRPIDDKRGTKEFRIDIAGVLARRTALIALERASKA
jgi:carbon-monoxide dehydrogenase medium subunit